jgi:hypothetical protein
METIYRAHMCDEPGCDVTPTHLILGFNPEKGSYGSFGCAAHVEARRARCNRVLATPNVSPLVIAVAVQPDECFSEAQCKALLQPYVIAAALANVPKATP